MFAQTNVANEPAAPIISDSQEMLRSNLHLQEQLHNALRAIEQSRQDADLAAKNSAALFTEKLNAVEKNLALQRERDLETILAMRESNRVALIAAAVLAGIGMIALFLTAYFQIRAMNRMTEISALVSSNFSFESNRTLGEGNSAAPAQLTAANQANARFLAAVEQLEKRVHDLDGAAGTKKIGLIEPKTTIATTPASPALATHDDTSPLAKGQSLLNTNEPEKALACFEEALRADANNAEALVKKGSALEALRKIPEAIEAYDRAIAADSSLTVAYLYKGGALNRLQRFAEAMECYELALGTPKKADLAVAEESMA